MKTQNTDRRHTHRATCQVCGAVQALTDGATLAKHGYTVDWGWFNGTCEGSDNAPVEHDLTLLNITANSLTERAENLESITIDKITDVTVRTYGEVVNGRRERIDTTVSDQASIDALGSRDTFERLAEVKLYSLHRQAKHIRSHVAQLYAIAKDRHGAEPYAVQELKEQAAAKAARPTKASVKRIVEGLNRDFSQLWNEHRAAAYAADVPHYLHQYRAAKHASVFGADAAKIDALVEQMNEAKATLKRA